MDIAESNAAQEDLNKFSDFLDFFLSLNNHGFSSDTYFHSIKSPDHAVTWMSRSDEMLDAFRDLEIHDEDGEYLEGVEITAEIYDDKDVESRYQLATNYCGFFSLTNAEYLKDSYLNQYIKSSAVYFFTSYLSKYSDIENKPLQNVLDKHQYALEAFSVLDKNSEKPYYDMYTYPDSCDSVYDNQYSAFKHNGYNMSLAMNHFHGLFKVQKYFLMQFTEHGGDAEATCMGCLTHDPALDPTADYIRTYYDDIKESFIMNADAGIFDMAFYLDKSKSESAEFFFDNVMIGYRDFINACVNYFKCSGLLYDHGNFFTYITSVDSPELSLIHKNFAHLSDQQQRAFLDLQKFKLQVQFWYQYELNTRTKWFDIQKMTARKLILDAKNKIVDIPKPKVIEYNNQYSW